MFESVLMQVQTGIPALDSLVALIVAIAGIATAVGAVTHSLSMRPELSRYRNGLNAATGVLSDVGNHIIQSKEDIKSLAEITYNSLPDQGKAIVNQQNVRLAELEKKLEIANEQLSKLPTILTRI